MAKFLANENVPADAIEAVRQRGVDPAWVKERAAGAADETVLAMSRSENRVLVTFDKDFGEMAFRKGHDASCGVILLRPRLRSPEFLVNFLVAVLTKSADWQGHFAVAQEGSIRIVPLPR